MSLNKLGHESLVAFIQTIREVILNNDPFNFIVAASDSGQITAYITEEIFKGLNKTVPPKLILPIFRHIDKERTLLFDNTVIAPQFVNWRDTSLGNVLLVDDEIWRGATLNGTLDILLHINCRPQKLTIVAEDGGFRCPPTMRGIQTVFVPTKQRIPDVYNLISYTTPDNFASAVKEALQDEPALNDKQVICTLLNLPVKDRDDTGPYFTGRLLQKVEVRIPDFKTLQHDYRIWLRETIQTHLTNQSMTGTSKGQND